MAFLYVTEEGTYIKLKSNRYVVMKQLETIVDIPCESLEGLVIFDKVQISSQAIAAILQQGVFITWITGRGEYIGRLESPFATNVDRQKQQMLLSMNDEYKLAIAKQFVNAKVNNSIVLLRRYNRERMIESVYNKMGIMSSLKNKIPKISTIDALMGHEGYLAKLYFEALAVIVPEKFRFRGRSKNPPLDMFNAMLSMGYTLLQYEIQTSVINYGLNAYFSFYHTATSRYTALAYDLIEEWRAPIVDSLVLSLMSSNQININDFSPKLPNGAIYLNHEGRKKFIIAYEKKMLSINQYCGASYSYRHTINWQVESLIKSIMANDASLYEPIIIR